MALTAKEAFWKEHQDSLVRIRSQLSSHGNKSPGYRRTPVSQKKPRTSPKQGHPLYGKYRRTPSPYLPKMPESPHDGGPSTPPLRGRKFEVVPPVKPRQAFVRSKPDYDSWGEESDEEDDDVNDEDDGNVKKSKRGRYQPKPYPQPSPVVFGNPFAAYYPPPPKGANRNKRWKGKRAPTRSYKGIHHDRQPYQSMTDAKNKRNKKQRAPQYPMPVFGLPMMPIMMPPVDRKYKYIYGDEDESSEDEMAALAYLQKHPMFADDFVSSLITEVLEEDIIPDTLIEGLNEFDGWGNDHPAYLPTLYSCEDVMTDGIADIVEDIVREVAAEYASDYFDEKNLQRDPLDDFLSKLLSDAVDLGVRDVVRESVMDMADQYMMEEQAAVIFQDVFHDHLIEIMPDVVEDIRFELIAEDFIEKEVIAPEVEEEAAVVAQEMLQHYDNKVTKRELREVTKKANGQLVDSLFMGYLLSIIARQGKLYTQDDHANRLLDDMILNIAMEQYYGVQKMKDKTLQNKPLKKLHEKAFTEVSLDVCLQQLTASLDEDLADVDEFERGLNDGVVQPIPLSTFSSFSTR